MAYNTHTHVQDKDKYSHKSTFYEITRVNSADVASNIQDVYNVVDGNFYK